MNVFEFRQHLVTEYSAFTRSFTRIKADDIRAFVDTEYASQKYWPEPLVQINPILKFGLIWTSGSGQYFCDAYSVSTNARMSSALMRVKLRVKAEYSETRCVRNSNTFKVHPFFLIDTSLTIENSRQRRVSHRHFGSVP